MVSYPPSVMTLNFAASGQSRSGIERRPGASAMGGYSPAWRAPDINGLRGGCELRLIPTRSGRMPKAQRKPCASGSR